MMRVLTCAIWAGGLVLFGCSEVAGIEAIPPCEPGCQDETTRRYCDSAGHAQFEACPASTEECAAATCQAGACTFKPAVGAPCGEAGTAQCNEGYACLGENVQLSAILQQTCLVADDGKVWCWGVNQFQQLGDGTNKSALHPVLVVGLPTPAKQVSVGYGHTCALLRSGQVYCWGNNTVGQCGVAASASPVADPVLADVPGVRFTSVMTGQGHTCAIAEDKSVYCWGSTGHGQCGSDPEVTGIHVGPTKVPDLDSVESIVSVKNHTCAVQSKDPRVSCWGSNTHIEEGIRNHKLGPGAGDVAYSPTPVPVELDAPLIGAGMGFESTYALTEDGRVHAWGRNNRGQLGIEAGASTTPTATPALVMVRIDGVLAPLVGVESMIRSDGSDMCVKMRDPKAFDAPFLCWGGDDWGEVGAGTMEGARTTHPFPIPLRALSESTFQLVRGEDHGCGAVQVDGRTEIWCYGRPGVLGNGVERSDNADRPSQWEGTPVIWQPDNFAPALAAAEE